MTKPLVSIVIVNYNSGSYLTECVRSALPQAGEILIVDNASSDASVDLCMKNFAHEPKLKIIHNQINLGFAVACNIGAMQATGDFVCF